MFWMGVVYACVHDDDKENYEDNFNYDCYEDRVIVA